MMAAKKRGLGLGRGLDVLLGARDSADAAETAAGEANCGSSRSPRSPPASTSRGARSTRTSWKNWRPIRSQGVIEPVIVRVVGPGRHELIAGERRWRAAQRAGLSEIPALVRGIDDRAAVAIALIENIQREDLSALEEGNHWRA